MISYKGLTILPLLIHFVVGTIDDDPWESFKKQYNKTYTKEEDLKRQEIFLANLKIIQQHNDAYSAEISSVKLKVNEFADMTELEFLNMKTNPLQVTNTSSLLRSPDTNFGNYRIPDNVDWRSNGFVSPVQNQGSCMSGSIFAALGALEGQQKHIYSSLVPMSAQQLFDCCGLGSCQGCHPNSLSPRDYFECIDDIDGLDSDMCYRFTGKCNECKPFPKCISLEVQGFTTVHSGNEEALKNAVALVGPIAASINANRPKFRYLDGSSGIFSDPSCRSDVLTHSVTIVGYGVENTTPYWLIKNSWGTSWGDNGYAKIARNRNNMCGIATQAVYPNIVIS